MMPILMGIHGLQSWASFLGPSAVVMGHRARRIRLLVLNGSEGPLSDPESQLFGRMLEAIGLSEESVQWVQGSLVLEEMISESRPEMILALGASLGSLVRGELGQVLNTPAILTSHPSEVLNDSSLKKAAWEDLKRVAQALKLSIPSASRSSSQSKTE